MPASNDDSHYDKPFGSIHDLVVKAFRPSLKRFLCDVVQSNRTFYRKITDFMGNNYALFSEKRRTYVVHVVPGIFKKITKTQA